MTTLILGAAMSAAIGTTTQYLMNSVASAKQLKDKNNYRLKNLAVQTSTYGRSIPEIYGTAKIAGNIIWSTDIKEEYKLHKLKAGSKATGQVKQHFHDYQYKISLAIAICKGPITSIERIWANGKILDLRLYNYRIYLGDEDQMPDSYIQLHLGIDKTPAYRGIAYVIFEDLSLVEFANSIPDFIFEVKQHQKTEDYKNYNLEDMIEAVTIIPGSGEFVYDTKIIYQQNITNINNNEIKYGPQIAVNINNDLYKVDSVLSLDNLQKTCNNIKWTAPVVSWFIDDINIKNANIYPAIEYKHGKITSPDIWQVGNVTRNEARLMTLDHNNQPIYGGTINDNSIIRYLEEMKSRNLKIMFYPMIFVDNIQKPWRGYIGGNPEDIKDFFNRENGYNNFILHYANLVKGKVDAFIIGSELKSLTKIKDENNNFPAVDELIKLAKKVKEILTDNVIITYAADWSEYHHTENGWYHLDKLWASQYIDVVGIDAYFPLTDENKENIENIIDGWESGILYDYCYDKDNNKQLLSPEYAIKNIKYWWENKHKNPDGKYTHWKKKMKPIWFTEFGFPSIDGATREPNVFYDPTSQDSKIPKTSNGLFNPIIQRQALLATLIKWHNSDMVTNKFIWTWDARPYPAWPQNKNMWQDYKSYYLGHWIQGKIACYSLKILLKNLLDQANLSQFKYDLSQLDDYICGIVIDHSLSIKNMIKMLQELYAFNLIFNADQIIAKVSCKSGIVATILYNDLVLLNEDQSAMIVSNFDKQELPTTINLNYIKLDNEYKIGNVQAQKFTEFHKNEINLDYPIILNDDHAKEIANNILHKIWQENIYYKFYLGTKFLYLNIGDIVEYSDENKQKILLKINKITANYPSLIEIEAIRFFEEDKMNYNNLIIANNDSKPINYEAIYSELAILKIENENNLKLAFAIINVSNIWYGAEIELQYKNHDRDDELIIFKEKSDYGVLLSNIIYKDDNINQIEEYEIWLHHGQIDNNGGKLYINDEIISFKNAEILAEHHYKISNIIRSKTQNHNAGDQIILLNNKIQYIELEKKLQNIEILYKIINYKTLIIDAEEYLLKV